MSKTQLPDFPQKPQKYVGPSKAEVLQKRQKYINPGIFQLYQKPVMFVEGKMQYLFDETGKRYLDVYGGIVTVSVGHCHPYVTAAAKRQMDLLQHSTTIYLNPKLGDYAEKLAQKLPEHLRCIYFVNSGSEANDLAIMMARLYTGNYDIIGLRNAYHGGNMLAMGLTAHNTWKFNVPTKFGIHHVMNANPYRGIWTYDDPDAGKNYANEVSEQIIHATPGKVAAFISESIQGVGGAVVYPQDYLKRVYETTRAAGGLCICDEVQAGFARCGSEFWGFQTYGVKPDIVTMAKGIGNGTPLAAVATSHEIAKVIAQKIHFNTYGGNPIAMAIGEAVIDVIDDEDIQGKAKEQGAYLRKGLLKLQEKHNIIGDVRGCGLMVGIELVKDRKSKEPASDECAKILHDLLDRAIVIGKGGLYGNTLRVKPPMCISKADIDYLLANLDESLTQL